MIKIVIYSCLYVLTIFVLVSSYILSSHPISSYFLTYLRYGMIFFASILLAKYSFYMLIAPWYDVVQKKRRLKHKREYNPLVSIMIPAWNEGSGLIATVRTILSGTYKNIEIIVINDGSTDNSDILMKSFIKKYENEMRDERECPKIVYRYKDNGGKGSALNEAISLSKGEILLSIDADCIVRQDAIENFVEVFRDEKVMAAVGNVIIGNTKTFIGTLQYLEYLFGFYFKKADDVMGTIYIIGGAAGAFRREVFDILKGYSLKNITEDIELSVRIQDMGWRIAYVHTAIIFTEGASSLKGLIKQRVRWKRGRMQTFSEHRDLFFSLKKRHNKILCWAVLPLAFFGDVQLALELPFITCMYVIAILTGDFSSFVSGVIIVSLMFFIQALDNKQTAEKWYILLAFIGWLLFYVTTYVEVVALIQSILATITKKEVKWQKWQRKGAIDS